MNPTPPNQKNIIEDSTIRVGQNAHFGDSTTYNNYFQGEEVTIPRHLTNNIPRNADHVLGREEELEAIATQLANKRATVLVNGIGGIGKTSVAIKYIVQKYDKYAHFAWLTVSGTIEETFINDTVLAASLHLTKDIQDLVTAKNIKGAFELIFKKLNDLSDTLIVIDNANDLGDLLQHKNLFDNAHCHIFLTSRTLPQAWQIVKIKPLPNDKAMDVFRQNAPSVAPCSQRASLSHEDIFVSDKDLLQLLAHLDFHTLLIELVAKSAEVSKISFVTLQQIIQKHFIHDPLLSKRKVETGTHGITVEDNAQRAKVEDYIWLIFQNIADISTQAKEILKTIALLPVATAFDDDFLVIHIQSFGIENNVIETLDNLVELGWLESDQKENKPAYKIHPLIADVAKKHLELTVDFAEAYIVRVAELISYNPQNPKHNLSEKNKNRPLAERLSVLFFDENTEGMSELLNSLLSISWQLGFYQKAAEYGERALKIAEIIFEKNHEIVTIRQSNLANVYGDLGKYDKAVELLEAALGSALSKFGIEHSNVAMCQSNLGDVYRNLGKYDKAAELLEAALASDLKNFGQEHPNVTVHQSNLANVYRDLGKYDKAADLLEAALASDLKNFGQVHPNVAASQSNLAAVYLSLSKYTQAAELLEMALANNLKNFGHEHPIVAKNQNDLALVYGNLGKQNKAAELLEAALASDLKNFGQEHQNVAFCQWNLAVVYIDINRKPEAKVLLQAAYQNLLKNLGAEHPDTVNIQTWFAKAE
jgi:tetratricopeptide (TPR) repeat protein